MAINKNKVIASAQRYAQKGQIDRAIKEYRSIVDEDPEDVRIWLKIGDLYTKKGSLRDAVGTYTRVALYYSDKQHYLKAVAVYKQILNIDPTYIEAHLKLAELYVQLGLTPDAIGQYQIVVGAYERDARHKESLDLLRRIVELAPDELAARIRLAEAHVRQAENDAAAGEYRFVLNLLYQNGRFDEYVQVAERLLYLAPADLDVIRTLAEVHLRRGDAKRALARLQTLFKADPTSLDTLSLLARAFTELGQHVKAVSVYRELARLHGEVGDENGRLEAYRRILALDPYDNEAINIVGTSHRGGAAPGIEAQRSGEWAAAPGITSTGSMPRIGAVASPVEEAALTPGQQVTQYLADVDLYLKYELGEHALGRLNDIFQIQPDHVGALVKLKEVSLALRRPNDALSALVRLARAIGDTERDVAMSYLGEALQIQPDHPEATRLMQRLSQGMAANLTNPPEAQRPVSFAPQPMSASVEDVEVDFDLDAIDLDEEPAPRPARQTGPRVIVPVAPDDDFSDLLGEGSLGGAVPSDSEFDRLLTDGDDFDDLLGDETRGTKPVASAASAADDELGDLMAPEESLDDPMADDSISPRAAARAAEGRAVARADDDFFGATDGDDDGFGDLLGTSPNEEVTQAVLPPGRKPAADDLGGLVSEPAAARGKFGRSGPSADTVVARLDDDFGDLLSGDAPPPPPARRPAAPAPAYGSDALGPSEPTSAGGLEDDFGDLLDAPAPARATEDDFGDLLDAPAPARATEDDFGGLLDEPPSGARRPADDDFGDLLDEPPPRPARRPADDDFGDLLAEPPPRPARRPADDDFGDLLAAAEAASEVADPSVAQPVEDIAGSVEIDPGEDLGDLLDAPQAAGGPPSDELSDLLEDLAATAAAPTPAPGMAQSSIREPDETADLDDFFAGRRAAVDHERATTRPLPDPTGTPAPLDDFEDLLGGAQAGAPGESVDLPDWPEQSPRARSEAGSADDAPDDLADFDDPWGAPSARPGSQSGPIERVAQLTREESPARPAFRSEPPAASSADETRDELSDLLSELSAVAASEPARGGAAPSARQDVGERDLDAGGLDFGAESLTDGAIEFDEDVGISQEAVPGTGARAETRPSDISGLDLDAEAAADDGADSTVMVDLSAEAFGATFQRPAATEAPAESAEIELEADLSSLPGVDLGLSESDGDEIELLDDDDLEVVDDSPDEAEDAVAGDSPAGDEAAESDEGDFDLGAFDDPEAPAVSQVAAQTEPAGQASWPPAAQSSPAQGASAASAPSARASWPPAAQSSPAQSAQAASAPSARASWPPAAQASPAQSAQTPMARASWPPTAQASPAQSSPAPRASWPPTAKSGPAAAPVGAAQSAPQGLAAQPSPSGLLAPVRSPTPPADLGGELEELDFLLDSNLVDEARELLDELRQEHPGHPDLEPRRARLAGLGAAPLPAAAEDDDFDPASVQGATLTDLADEDVHAHFDLGLAFKEMGRYEKAIEQLEKAARAPGSRPEALRVMALCDMALGNASRAVSRLQDAVALPNLGPDARLGLHYDLASAFEALGDAPSAIAHLREIADSDFLDTRARLRRLGG